MSNPYIALAREDIQAMTAYSSARREAQTGEIWLNANENPYNVYDSAGINRYPDPQPSAVLDCLTALYEVEPEQLLLTRGADEGIDVLVRTFCRAYEDAIMVCPPTYGMYAISATIQGARVIQVPLQKANGFQLDLKAIHNAWEPQCKLIVLCSPNNPTGQRLAPEAVLCLCETYAERALIVVDEAYIEFADAPSFTQKLSVYPNLVVLRTLSKALGLAGIRCGAVLANPVITALLSKVLAPYPIPSLISDFIRHSLTPQRLQDSHEKIALMIQAREMLQRALAAMDCVTHVFPSEANFILIEVNDVDAVMTHCAEQGIILRDRSQMVGLERCLRISLGTPQENQRLLEVLTHV